MRRSLIYCIFLSLIIIAAFWRITQTFYQQDEWLGYGLYLAKGAGMIMQSTGGILGVILGQGRILTNLLYFLFYKYSPLNVFPIAIFAIIFHIINTLIVFFLAKKLFKKILPAFLGGLFFALNSVSQSAVTWPAASINTLPSTALILIALIFYFRYLESFKEKWMVLSFAFVYLSLFFKETGVFLFLILPLFSLVYKKQSIGVFVKRYWYFLAATFFIVVYRIWGFKSEPNQVALFLTGSSSAYWQTFLTRAFLYPLTSFSLTLVPSEPFLWFARSLSKIYYPFIAPQQFNLIVQTIVLDLLAVLLSAIIGFFSLPLFKISDPKIKKNIVFWFVFLFASFLPYIIISKSYSYLESRYYYLASVAWGIIFAWTFVLIEKRVKMQLFKVLAVLFYVLFIFTHTRIVISDVGKLVTESQTRVSFLSQISSIVPTLTNDRNIFYITGDSDFYLPGNKVPFQQGFGYTLMSLYYDSGKIPKELLSNGYLFEIGGEGYKEVSGKGFGYFSDKNVMKDTLSKYNVGPTITYFYYDSKTDKILKKNNAEENID